MGYWKNTIPPYITAELDTRSTRYCSGRVSVQAREASAHLRWTSASRALEGLGSCKAFFTSASAFFASSNAFWAPASAVRCFSAAALACFISRSACSNKARARSCLSELQPHLCNKGHQTITWLFHPPKHPWRCSTGLVANQGRNAGRHQAWVILLL